MRQHTWVIGAGGLLGSALCRALDDSYVHPPIPWNDPHASADALSQALRNFREVSSEEPWSIIWAAGYATTSTLAAETESELRVFKQFLSALGQNPPAGRGRFAFVSSAGAIYAGSSNPPFTSATTPLPISAYGKLKLAQEDRVRTLRGENLQTSIVRVSNVYGPGQNLNKLQGIVSSLCWSAITKRQVNIFVPLDTLRDYIYVDDAAARILHWAEPGTEAREQRSNTEIVATGRPISLGHVINTVEDVLHMRIPVSFGMHAAASFQAHDLRLIPSTDSSIDALPTMPFPAGVRRVFEDLLERRQAQHEVTSDSR